MTDTTDFGAPTEFGKHHFYVTTPRANRDAICIYEDFGFNGKDAGSNSTAKRLLLARELWTKIRDDAKRDFNARLRSLKQSTGNWAIGKVKLERFLGKELCVLGWAAEHADINECPIICQKWLALRPEERWWLYSKTASEAADYKATSHGWRKALYCLLSDGSSINLLPKKIAKIKKTQSDAVQTNLSLFTEQLVKGNN